MSDLTRMTAGRARPPPIAAGETSAVEVTQAHLDRIAAVDDRVHAFLHVDTEGALAAARAVDERRAAGEALGPLAGVPVAVKDVIATTRRADHRRLEDPRGLAPAVRRDDHDAAARRPAWSMLGKTNMDEFAMGSSTEYSRVRADATTRGTSTAIPGGSRGGSSAAVAAYEAPLAHRHRHRRLDPPARRGHRHRRRQADLRRHLPVRAGRVLVLAGHAGPVRPHGAGRGAAARGRSAGHDPCDSTSIPRRCRRWSRPRGWARTGDLTGVRVGLVTEFAGEGAEPGVDGRVPRGASSALDQARRRGASRCPARTSSTRCRPTT